MELLAPKAKNLQTLEKLGLNVPKFIVLQDGQAPKLQNIFPAQSYAVRSAAYTEDKQNSSMAGQFLTKLNLSKQQIPQAIQQLTQDAKNKGLKQGQFSIIIQEFIQPDLSGVVFTRNPLGSQHLIIEYHKGLGEDLVSGKVKPSKIISNTAPSIPWQKTLFQKARQIETHFSFPQDIEWCLKDEKLYFLQTRPITTLSTQQYQGHLYIEQKFQDQFYLAQTSLTESVGKIDKQTFALLTDIYAPDGPIHQVYKKHKIAYHPQQFLSLINGQLYVDKELELKTLQPAKSFFLAKNGKSQFTSFKGLITTISNAYKTSKISSKHQSLQDALLTKTHDDYSIQTKQQFLDDYALIFEISLLANLSIKNQQHLPQLLSCSQDLIADLPKINTKLKLTGNGLSFSDHAKFQSNISTKKATTQLKTYFQNNKEILSPILTLNRLRELARFLTVKNLNQIRPKTIQKYPQDTSIQLPQTISSFPIIQNTQIQVLSPGKATGQISTLEKIKPQSILLVKNLTPDLTAHFPKIKAIISQNGGILSHLAIMARENNIPVISGLDFQEAKQNKETSIDTSQQNPLEFF